MLSSLLFQKNDVKKSIVFYCVIVVIVVIVEMLNLSTYFFVLNVCSYALYLEHTNREIISDWYITVSGYSLTIERHIMLLLINLLR